MEIYSNMIKLSNMDEGCNISIHYVVIFLKVVEFKGVLGKKTYQLVRLRLHNLPTISLYDQWLDILLQINKHYSFK